MRCSGIFGENGVPVENVRGKSKTKSFFSANIRDNFCFLDWTGTDGSWGGGTDRGCIGSEDYLSGSRYSD